MSLFRRKKEESKTEEKKETDEKRGKIGLPQGKDPRLYKIVEKPIVTEKAVNLSGINNYVFKVSPKANKIEIRKAIEKLYDVRVRDVRIINTVSKKRQVGRFEGFKPGFKKAVVILEKGYKIEVAS